jgi:ferredoxin
MKLEIDWTRCDGHGLCASLLPSRISLDEWGFPVIAVSKVTPTELTDARRTVGVCPALALRLVDSRPAR